MKHTILIVDDDQSIRDALTDVLMEHDYTPHAVSDGLEALTYLRTRPVPRMILLDWRMPNCNGAQFLALQLADPALAAIPVVILSADVNLADKIEQIEVQHYLAKPVPLERLLAVLAEICG